LEPAVLEHLVEDLGRLELAALVLGHRPHDRLEDLAHPAVRGATPRRRLRDRQRRAVGVEVVEQAPGLVLLDVEPGEPDQPPGVVAGVDDLRLDPDRGSAAGSVDDRQLGDVEAEVVEPADVGVDPVPLAALIEQRLR
jgi:hypothetical protein